MSLGGSKEKQRTEQNSVQRFDPNPEYLGMVKSGLDEAMGLMGSYKPIDQARINEFANPYIDQVGEQISSQLGRTRDLASNDIRGRAAAAGAFGGSGWGLLEAENQRSFADAEAQALTGLRAGAYDKATATAQSEEERRMQTALASIQARLGGLGLLGNWGTTTGTGLTKQQGSGFKWGMNF